jgi:hypothetical protein
VQGRHSEQEQGWGKVKNPNYWRHESEIELMQRRRERSRVALTASLE